MQIEARITTVVEAVDQRSMGTNHPLVPVRIHGLCGVYRLSSYIWAYRIGDRL
jgi:hypothetical protein